MKKPFQSKISLYDCVHDLSFKSSEVKIACIIAGKETMM